MYENNADLSTSYQKRFVKNLRRFLFSGRSSEKPGDVSNKTRGSFPKARTRFKQNFPELPGGLQKYLQTLLYGYSNLLRNGC